MVVDQEDFRPMEGLVDNLVGGLKDHLITEGGKDHLTEDQGDSLTNVSVSFLLTKHR